MLNTIVSMIAKYFLNAAVGWVTSLVTLWIKHSKDNREVDNGLDQSVNTNDTSNIEHTIGKL